MLAQRDHGSRPMARGLGAYGHDQCLSAGAPLCRKVPLRADKANSPLHHHGGTTTDLFPQYSTLCNPAARQCPLWIPTVTSVHLNSPVLPNSVFSSSLAPSLVCTLGGHRPGWHLTPVHPRVPSATLRKVFSLHKTLAQGLCSAKCSS
eukprot:scaffold54942_cov75-Phaeocystis_antarctica.AAC.6